MSNPRYSKVAVGEDEAAIAMMAPASTSTSAQSNNNNDLSLQENLIGIPDGQSLPVASSIPMLQVVAPATLPEGYEFEANIGGVGGQQKTLKVVVPPGGVEEGQKFEVPFPTQPNMEQMMTTTGAGGVTSSVSIPVGHWRDSIWYLFRYGVCHPHCWTGSCCHLLAAGQVISRLKLTWYGRPGSVGQAAVAFKIIFVAVVVYFILYIGLYFLLVALDPNVSQPIDAPRIEPGPDFMKVLWVRSMFHYIYWGTTTAVLTNLRRYVRQKYAIPPSECCKNSGLEELEDCCCSCWCPCFTSAQMLRHTTDYDVYPATCCTETGIPPHAPSIV